MNDKNAKPSRCFRLQVLFEFQAFERKGIFCYRALQLDGGGFRLEKRGKGAKHF